MRRNENSPATETLRFSATDVTETMTVDVDVRRDVPAGVVTRSIAHDLALPRGLYALRDDSSVYLDEDRPIGEQVSPDARLTVTPRTHLG